MSQWLQELINEVEELGEKPALVVEGKDDIDAFTYFLNQSSLDWNKHVLIRSVDKKDRVITAVKNNPHWAGIVDVDEWSPTEVAQQLKNVPRVKVLPRFCLENYFCVPTEIWAALPLASKNKVDFYRLNQPILDELPKWVKHGAIWRVIRTRRTSLLYKSGFPQKLDDTPVEDAEIRPILTEWHNQINPDRIIAEYEIELAEAQQRTSNDQLKCYVHGKKFFNRVVVPTLNILFGQANETEWVNRLTQQNGLRVPDDLRIFLSEILNLFVTP